MPHRVLGFVLIVLTFLLPRSPALAVDSCCCYSISSLGSGYYECTLDCDGDGNPDCEVEGFCTIISYIGCYCKENTGRCLNQCSAMNCGTTLVGTKTCHWDPVGPNCPVDTLDLCLDGTCPGAGSSYACSLGGPCCHTTGKCR